MDHCLKCKTKTENKNDEIVTLPSGRKQRKSVCVVCDRKKCCFIPSGGAKVKKSKVEEIVEGEGLVLSGASGVKKGGRGGKTGGKIMKGEGFIGSALGSFLGKKLGASTHRTGGEFVGGLAGSVLGSVLPF